MTLSLEVVNPMHCPGWDDRLLTNPEYSFFHTSFWAKVLSDSYGYSPHYVASIDHYKISVLLPVMEVNSVLTGRRGVSLPFSDYCDPLIAEGIPFEPVMMWVIEYGRNVGWKTIELRSTECLFRENAPSSSYFRHVMELTDGEERILSRLRDSTKRNIRKAGKEGVTVRISRSLESVETFYRLNCLTRKEHGLPPQPLFFFRNLHRHILSKGLGITVLASHGDIDIAGCLYLQFGEKAFYKYGASDRKYQHLRANNLVMWEAIRWFSRNGCKTLCFGRTEPENEGLRQFKTGWGTREESLYYYKYDLSKKQYIRDRLWIYGFHNRVFENMPIPLSRIVGSLMYRHMA
jgi:hypothetical protein